MDTQNRLKIEWSFNFRKRKSAEISRLAFLRKVAFFEHLSEKQLKTLSRFLHERRFEENEYLFEENHPGAALFIIATGEVAVEVEAPDQSVVQIATLKSGQFLGELALLDDSPRSASAKAVVPTQCYAFSRAELNRLQKEDPLISIEIYKTLAWVIGERLKAMNRSLDSKSELQLREVA
jgi:CRP-like cAMP-binding protein